MRVDLGRTHLSCKVSLPKMRVLTDGEALPEIPAGEGFERRFTLPELHEHMSLRSRVHPSPEQG